MRPANKWWIAYVYHLCVFVLELGYVIKAIARSSSPSSSSLFTIIGICMHKPNSLFFLVLFTRFGVPLNQITLDKVKRTNTFTHVNDTIILRVAPIATTKEDENKIRKKNTLGQFFSPLYRPPSSACSLIPSSTYTQTHPNAMCDGDGRQLFDIMLNIARINKVRTDTDTQKPWAKRAVMCGRRENEPETRKQKHQKMK